MSTSTLRLDESLRARIARLADASDQTPHAFMVQALTEKVVEAEWRLAMQHEAQGRDHALMAGEEAGVEWHEMKSWLQQRLQAPAPAEKPSRRTR